jgi:hypothetical protein
LAGQKIAAETVTMLRSRPATSATDDSGLVMPCVPWLSIDVIALRFASPAAHLSGRGEPWINRELGRI